MARKILNRKELRVEAEAAEGEGGEAKAAVKKAPVKRKSLQSGQGSPPEGVLGRLQPVATTHRAV